MKRYLILIILLWATGGKSQEYQYKGINPFGIQIINLADSTNGAFKFDFFDSDSDGDLDLNLMGLAEADTTSYSRIYNLRYFMEYQENNGLTNVAHYKAREKRYATLDIPKGKGFMIPSSGDINGDGQVDFVISAEVDLYNSQYLQFQISDGQGGYKKSNCLDWGLDAFPVFSFFIPELTDLDSDGDIDILLGGYRRAYDEVGEPVNIPVYLYAKNTGNPKNPKFLGWFENPYGLVPSGQSFFTSGDVDMDGDMDLLSMELTDDNVSLLNFLENIAAPGQKPRFAPPVVSPFGLPAAAEGETFLFPDLADTDRDGDLDFFLPYINDTIFELRYYENNMCSPDFKSMNASICPGAELTIGNQTFSVAGIYTIKTTNSSGCISLLQLNLTVLPEEQVNVSLDGKILSVPAVAGQTYRWLDCNSGSFFSGATSPNFTAPYTGSFAAEVTNSNGCSFRSACIFVTVSGTDDAADAVQIRIGPNPNNGLLYIDSKSLPVQHISVYTSDGTCVFRAVCNTDYVDLSALSNGLYLIRLDLGKKVVVRKMVIQK